MPPDHPVMRSFSKMPPKCTKLLTYVLIANVFGPKENHQTLSDDFYLFIWSSPTVILAENTFEFWAKIFFWF